MKISICFLFTCILIGFVFLSVQCQKKPSKNKGIEGNYKIDTRHVKAELSIMRLSDQKISFTATIAPKDPAQHTVVIDDEATITGNIATYQDEDDASCRFTITFSPDQAIIDGADRNCHAQTEAAALDGTYHMVETD